MAVSLPPSGEADEGRYQPLAEINVTPMVDVMLVLLIIFMVTAPLLTVGVPLDLPKSTAAELQQPKEPIVLSLDRDGGTFIGNEPHPAPTVSAGYRAMLSAWLEAHKRYPESARARGEEGRAVLRFRVDRSGRVLNYALASSTGFADLDAAIDAMMRGATLPPFPGDMTASDVEVSVTVRFSLTR
jgi:TonB family protein